MVLPHSPKRELRTHSSRRAAARAANRAHLVAGPAAICKEAIARDQQECLDRIVHSPEIRHLDVNNVGGPRGHKYLDVLESVAPLVNGNLHSAAACAQSGAQIRGARHPVIAISCVNDVLEM
jgi:hypothetical protein